jgi:hypothetical protein
MASNYKKEPLFLLEKTWDDSTKLPKKYKAEVMDYFPGRTYFSWFASLLLVYNMSNNENVCLTLLWHERHRKSTFLWLTTFVNNSTPHQTPPSWWCCLPIQRYGFGDSTHPIPRILFGRGCPRAVIEDLIQFYNLGIRFIFLLIVIALKTMTLHPPCNPPWSNLLSFIASPTIVYFGLVVVCILTNWQSSKATA